MGSGQGSNPEAAVVVKRLLGKSAVITGAARGIGRATAELFALEGARIVASDIDRDGLNDLRERLQAQGAEVVVVHGDVAKPDEARSMIKAAVDAYGRLDVLVANAGVIPLRTITEATPEDRTRSWPLTGAGCS